MEDPLTSNRQLLYSKAQGRVLRMELTGGGNAGRSERGEGSEEGPCELFLEQREVCTSLRECRTQET